MIADTEAQPRDPNSGRFISRTAAADAAPPSDAPSPPAEAQGLQPIPTADPRGVFFTGSVGITPDPTIQQPQTEVTPPSFTVPANQAQDPRMAQMSIRSNWTPAEKQFTEERQALGWGHVRPFSCYVGAIGNHWKPKSWAKVMDMVQFCNEQGAFVVFDEIQDRCHEPYDALGVMRNEVLGRAEYGGYEYVCMVDNDILPAPDTLFRIMRRMWKNHVTACAPLVTEPGTGRPLHGPPHEPYTGLKPVRWNVLSMLVFKTSIFRAFPPSSFWHDPRGADEGFHFQKLYGVGHSPMIDTDIVLQVSQAPTYPLTIEKQENKDAMWDSRKKAFAEIPDRRPERLDDPRVNEHGIYLPFLPVRCIPERGGCGNMVGGKWWEDSPVCPACQQKQGIASGMQLEGTADGAPDGFYRRCKAIENGKQCSNQTPHAHGYCANHVDRVGVA